MVAGISKNAAKKAAKQAAKLAAKVAKRGGAPLPPTDLLPPVPAHSQRFKVLLRYDGAQFHGWMPQHPPGQEPLRTVGDVVETAFREVLLQKVRVFPSGRTDAGVSASGQVCQFDAAVDSVGGLEPRLNAVLPPDVRVLAVSVAPKDFSAMGNLWKRYVYELRGGELAAAGSSADAHSGDPAGPCCPRLLAVCRRALQSHAAAEAITSVDVAAMNLAGAALTGEHDFAAFQTKGGRQTTVRTVHRCEAAPLRADGGQLLGVRITCEGNGFLYNMVRILAGTLLEVGCGLRTVEAAAALVAPAGEAGAVPTRAAAGPTLPAKGLCLEHVEYDKPWRG